jgi:curved DNA-binding protein
MDYKDYYAVLGVERNATPKEIQRAFRRLARQHHPDVNPNNKEAEERFKEINEAYEVLSDPEKRKRYDELGADWERYQRQPAGAAGGYTSQRMRAEDLQDLFGDESPFSSFFDTFFGGGTSRGAGAATSRPRRGQDIEAPVQVTLEEAARGGTRRLRLEDANGQMRQIEVKIPPGVRDGTRIRVAGQGGEGRDGGPRGDLYLLVEVLPHSVFERDGDNLRTTVRAKLTTMLLGGEVAVPTLDGRVMLKIPAGTNDGKVFRLRGKGMPRPNRREQRGDLYAEVHVDLPEHLSSEQRRIMEQFARTESGEPVGAGR